MYPRRWLSLSSRAKAFTLQGRHICFVGDSAFHTSLRGAPLLVSEQQKKWNHQVLLQKVQNLMPFPAFGNLNFVSPPHRRVYTSLSKRYPNNISPSTIFFPLRNLRRQDFRFERFKIFVQDFVRIRTALSKGGSYGNKILYKNLKFFDKIFVRKSCRRRFRNAPYGEKILLMGKCYVWA